MAGVPKKTKFRRNCKYCDKEYVTRHKYSHVCDECKMKMRTEKFKKRVRRTKPVRSYWRRLMDGEEL